MRRIAVVGASGFVGATVVERLRDHDEDVVPLIHSSGNAWRLARHGLTLRSVDLLDRLAVEGALDGCTHVVNCARGSDEAMLRGLRNLLAACRTRRVRRVVHLSSVAVYGDPPPPESRDEDAPTKPPKNSYGAIKLRQDELVARAARDGLSAIALCPPNISGPYSPFLLRVFAALRAARLRLVDDGVAVCNLVDVDNLAHAIELALEPGPADGRRMFVTDDEPITWRDIVDALTTVADPFPTPPAIGAEELRQLAAVAPTASPSLFGSLKHLLASDVRAVLRRDPLLAMLERVARGGVMRLGSPVNQRLRIVLDRPMVTTPHTAPPSFDVTLSAQQLRGVRHSCAVAARELGYQPVHSFAESMLAFRGWYRVAHAVDTDAWDLLRQLSGAAS